MTPAAMDTTVWRSSSWGRTCASRAWGALGSVKRMCLDFPAARGTGSPTDWTEARESETNPPKRARPTATAKLFGCCAFTPPHNAGETLLAAVRSHRLAMKIRRTSRSTTDTYCGLTAMKMTSADLTTCTHRGKQASGQWANAAVREPTRQFDEDDICRLDHLLTHTGKQASGQWTNAVVSGPTQGGKHPDWLQLPRMAAGMPGYLQATRGMQHTGRNAQLKVALRLTSAVRCAGVWCHTTQLQILLSAKQPPPSLAQPRLCIAVHRVGVEGAKHLLALAHAAA